MENINWGGIATFSLGVVFYAPVGALLALACGQNGASPQIPPESTPTEIIQFAPTPAKATLAEPSPTAISRGGSQAPLIAGAPTLEENIFKADVIAWVRPPASSGKAQTIPSEDGVAPVYRALLHQFLLKYVKAVVAPGLQFWHNQDQHQNVAVHESRHNAH